MTNEKKRTTAVERATAAIEKAADDVLRKSPLPMSQRIAHASKLAEVRETVAGIMEQAFPQDVES